MFPPVFATLKASAAVRNFVGQQSPRIYRHGSAPRDGSRPIIHPFITWSSSATPENQLSGLPPVDRVVVDINIWHKTDSGVEALALAVRDAVEPFAHCTGQPVDLREPETNLYRILLTFDWFLQREEIS